MEFWCNNGCDWYSLRKGKIDADDDWEKVTALIVASTKALDTTQYTNIHKFNTNLKVDPQSLFTQAVPEKKGGWK